MRVYTFTVDPYCFQWDGEAYIEVSPITHPDEPFHVINVWDDESDSSTIDQDSFPDLCERWLARNSSSFERVGL